MRIIAINKDANATIQTKDEELKKKVEVKVNNHEAMEKI